MASLTGQMKLRPTRIGFLVRPTDLPNLRRILQICSCLWGGIYNPIIPVNRSLPVAWCRGDTRRPPGRQLALSYVRFFEPDVFVETTPGLAQSIGIEDQAPTAFHPRVISLDEFVSISDGYDPEFKFGLDILDVYQDLYRTELQFVRRHNRLIATFHGHSRHDAYLEATFGGFPKHDALSYIRRAYQNAFEPTILKPDPSAWLQIVKERGHTPLTFTRHALTSRRYSDGNITIFVANPTSPLDLLDLWNLRLMRGNVLPVNSAWLPNLKDYLRDLVDRNYRPLRGNRRGLMSYTTVRVGNSFSEEEARSLVYDIFTDLSRDSWRLELRRDAIWSNDYQDHTPRPGPVQVYAESSPIEVPVSARSRPAIQVQSLMPKFASEYGFGHARWANVLTLKDYHNQHRLALALPSTAASSPYHHLRVVGPLLVSREGFILPQHFKDHQEYVELLSGTEAIIDWFKRNGINATISDAGRVSDQILSSLGGLSGARLLQDSRTLNLLDKMSKSTRRRGESTIEVYPDRTATVSEWKAILKRRNDSYSGSMTPLDRFVEAGALKLGLSVPCPNCKKENWYGLDDLAENVSCERCMKYFSFPQGSLNYTKSPWKFRLAGPYSVPDYAGGAYANVLALNCLANWEALSTAMTFSTNLNLIADGDLWEIDFACWLQRDYVGVDRREDPVFLIGEAKSFAENAFSGKDIARLKRIGKQMPGTFLVLAMLKEELSGADRDLIGKLATWGRVPDAGGRCRNPVIVLTGTELLAPYNISAAWKETGDERERLAASESVRMGDPRTLADLTQQVYLGLQPTYLWLQKYRRSNLPKHSVVT